MNFGIFGCLKENITQRGKFTNNPGIRSSFMCLCAPALSRFAQIVWYPINDEKENTCFVIKALALQCS